MCLDSLACFPGGRVGKVVVLALTVLTLSMEVG